MIQMQYTGKTQSKTECQLQCRTSMRIHLHYNRRHHYHHHHHHHRHHHHHDHYHYIMFMVIMIVILSALVSDPVFIVVFGTAIARAVRSTRSGADPTSVSPFQPHPLETVVPPLASGRRHRFQRSGLTGLAEVGSAPDLVLWTARGAPPPDYHSVGPIREECGNMHQQYTRMRNTPK